MFKRIHIVATLLLVLSLSVTAHAGRLPASLDKLIRQVQSTRVPYPARISDVNRLRRYVKDGDYRMARYKAKEIIRKQRALKKAKKGFPPALMRLAKEIDATKRSYPNRQSDLKQMLRYTKNGDFRMAEYKARQIIKKQKSLARAKGGLPPSLTRLVKQIDATQRPYPNRRSDIQRISYYVKNGDFGMAEYKAREVLKKQKALAQAKNGPPASLQRLLREIDATQRSYPYRASDMKRVRYYMRNGDFGMAAYKAREVLKKQRNLARARASGGLPPGLKSLLAQIKATYKYYPSRRHDMGRVQYYIRSGDFGMAKYKANEVLRKQRNLRR